MYLCPGKNPMPEMCEWNYALVLDLSWTYSTSCLRLFENMIGFLGQTNSFLPLSLGGGGVGRWRRGSAEWQYKFFSHVALNCGQPFIFFFLVSMCFEDSNVCCLQVCTCLHQEESDRWLRKRKQCTATTPDLNFQTPLGVVMQCSFPVLGGLVWNYLKVCCVTLQATIFLIAYSEFSYS